MAATHIDDLTALLATAIANADLFYVGKPGDADPDRKMTKEEMGKVFALLTGATFTGDVETEASTLAQFIARRDDGVNVGEAALGVSSATGLPVILRRIFDGVEGGRLGIEDQDITFRHGGAGADLSIADLGGASDAGYVRFYNGLQICWEQLSSTDASSKSLSNNNSLGGFRSGQTDWTFPAAFSAVPSIAAMNHNNSQGVWILAGANATTNGFYAFHAAANGTVADGMTIHMIAIGWWY